MDINKEKNDTEEDKRTLEKEEMERIMKEHVKNDRIPFKKQLMK